MADPYILTGKMKVIYDMQKFASGFTKREFVVTQDDDYPQDIKFNFKKDRCSILDSFKVGDQVKVTFRIRGNEYKERYYVDLDAFRLEKIESAGDGTVEYDEPPAPAADNAVPDDDLPF